MIVLLIAALLCMCDLDTGNQGVSSSSLPSSPLPHPSARVGPLELANALAACVLSARLTSKHRQWAAKQLLQALAGTGRDGPNRPQTYSDLAGDLRKSPLKRLEGHYNKVRESQCDQKHNFFLNRDVDSFVSNSRNRPGISQSIMRGEA